MMRLIGVGRASAAAEVLTLDDLWRRAEQLGRIEVDHRFGDKAYRVQIRFQRGSGSMVWATGHADDIVTAMCQAISEAEAIGAR